MIAHNGGYILRKDAMEEVELVLINFFESLDAVRRFAGENYTVAVFEPEAERLLSRIEPEAAHYEVRADPISFQTIFQQSNREH